MGEGRTYWLVLGRWAKEWPVVWERPTCEGLTSERGRTGGRGRDPPRMLRGPGRSLSAAGGSMSGKGDLPAARPGRDWSDRAFKKCPRLLRRDPVPRPGGGRGALKATARRCEREPCADPGPGLPPRRPAPRAHWSGSASPRRAGKTRESGVSPRNGPRRHCACLRRDPGLR